MKINVHHTNSGKISKIETHFDSNHKHSCCFLTSHTQLKKIFISKTTKI